MTTTALYIPSRWCYFGIIYVLYVCTASCDGLALGSKLPNVHRKDPQQSFDNNGTERTTLSNNAQNEEKSESTTKPTNSTSNTMTEWIVQQDSNAVIDYIDVLGHFLELQLEACPYVRLCTIENGDKDIYLQADDNVECCHYCSCEDACINNGNCCPDYLAFKLLKAKFTHIEYLKLALKDENNIRVIEQYIIEMEDTSGSNRIGEECVKTQLIPINDEISPHAKDYKLVTKCSPSYPYDTTREKCEGQSSSFNITDHLPVHSTKSFKSYRNIHCLICNDLSQTDSLDWETIIYCSSNVFTTLRYFEHVTSMVKYFLNREDKVYNSECNIVFEPTPNYNVEKCTIINTDTCTSKPEDQTDIQWTTYKQMCETFVLPVDKKYRAVNTFKNIACFYCNEGSVFKENCINYYITSGQYSMHISPDFIKTGDTGDTLDIVFDLSGICSKGHVLDRNKLCRKVLCPQGTFVLEGNCYSLLTTATNLSYKCIFKLEVLYENIDLEDLTDSRITEGILELSKTVVDGVLLGQYSGYTVFFTPGNQFYLLYVIIDVQNRTGESMHIYNMFYRLLEQLSIGTIDLGIHKLRVHTEVFSDIYIKEADDLVMYDFSNAHLLKKDVVRAKALNTPVTRITKAHICLRIKLDEDEVINRGYYLLVKQSNSKIPREDIEFDSIDGHPIVCMDQTGLLQGDESTNEGNATMFINTSRYDNATIPNITQRGSNSKNLDLEKGVYPIAAISGLVLFVIVLRKLINSNFRKRNENTQ